MYDNKFESKFYIISNSNKCVYSSGKVYTSSSMLPNGEYNLQLHLSHTNVQILGKMRQSNVIPWVKFGREGSLSYQFYVFHKQSIVVEVYQAFLLWLKHLIKLGSQ